MSKIASHRKVAVTLRLSLYLERPVVADFDKLHSASVFSILIAHVDPVDERGEEHKPGACEDEPLRIEIHARVPLSFTEIIPFRDNVRKLRMCL